MTTTPFYEAALVKDLVDLVLHFPQLKIKVNSYSPSDEEVPIDEVFGSFSTNDIEPVVSNEYN